MPVNTSGLSDFLSDTSLQLADVINPSGLNPNLDIIDPLR